MAANFGLSNGQLDGTGNGQFSAVANAQPSIMTNGPPNSQLFGAGNGGLTGQHIAQQVGMENGPFGSANLQLFGMANGGLPTQQITQPIVPPPIFNPQTMYPNFSWPKGPALVISNSKFLVESKLSVLNGAERDVQNVTQLFTNFGYNVDVFRDLTADQMTHRITALSKSPALSKSDSIVIVLMSHGDNDRLFGVDGRSMLLGDIVPLFSSKNCRALIDKPKLFFIDACRGGQADIGAVAGTVMPQSVRLVPTEADMLISFATTPGHIAWRYDWGSIYINALCTTFGQLAHHSELQHMLIKVHATVSDQLLHFQKTAPYVQMPETLVRLRRLFYFSPNQFYQPIQLCLPPQPRSEPEIMVLDHCASGTPDLNARIRQLESLNKNKTTLLNEKKIKIEAGLEPVEPPSPHGSGSVSKSPTPKRPRHHSAKRSYECVKCKEEFTDKSRYQAHIDSAHSNPSYRCDICGQYFHTAHLRKIHQELCD